MIAFNFFLCFFFLTFLKVSDGRFNNYEFAEESFEEYCDGNDFHKECNNNERILIKEALFGIKQGKCLNWNEEPCLINVTNKLNSKCLGEKTCLESIPTRTEDLKRCLSKYIGNFYVKSECIPVQFIPCNSCLSKKKAVFNEPSGFISGSLTDNFCGSVHCPWVIQGSAGQSIELEVLDYSSADNHLAEKVEHSTKLLSVRDESQASDISISSNSSNPKRVVYKSLNNKVEVVMESPTKHMLLHYKIQGCPDLTLSSSAWQQREHNKLRIGCADSEEAILELECIDNNWTGEMDMSCNGDEVLVGSLHSRITKVSRSENSFFSNIPPGLLIAGVVALTIIFSVCILMGGFIVYKKTSIGRGYKAARPSSMSGDQYVDISDPNSSLVQKILQQKNQNLPSSGENKYAMNNRVKNQTMLMLNKKQLSSTTAAPIPEENATTTRPLPSIPDLRNTGLATGPAPINPNMMISYRDNLPVNCNDQGNKYYSVDTTSCMLSYAELNNFPPPPELLHPTDSSLDSKTSKAHNTYENQQAILGTMATAGITAVANKQNIISTPLNV